jgi:sodium/pantothenate symporter
MTLDEACLLATFLAYLVGVFVLAALSRRLLEGRDFLSEYFLGSRSLGMWAFAFTFAATSASGGTFMGFPALIYRYGWCLALWIASYMVFPIVAILLLGKRLNQMGRLLGALTVPDVLRERFQSPWLGFAGGVAILVFLSFNLVAQFKAGGLVVRTVLEGLPFYDELCMEGLGWVASLVPGYDPRLGPPYWGGLILFAFMVVTYTTYGGFRAAVWTDVMQGVIMGLGILILLTLSLAAVGGLSTASQQLAAEDPALLTPPGPPTGRPEGAFLALPTAISFWVMWPISGAGQPGNLVRLMAFRDVPTMKCGVITVMLYYNCIYLPLVVTFVCARAIIPYGSIAEDQVMPVLARTVAPGWLAGIILAAPFAAVMSTVDSFLLVLASAIVRDLLQQALGQSLSPRMVMVLSYAITASVGTLATLVALDPPQFLQDIVVFTSAGLASCFLVPVALGLYWPRATAAGAWGAMLLGAGVHLALYLPAWFQKYVGASTGSIVPIRPLGLDPVVWGLVSSLAAGVFLSLVTRPPAASFVRRLFPD